MRALTYSGRHFEVENAVKKVVPRVNFNRGGYTKAIYILLSLKSTNITPHMPWINTQIKNK